MALDYVVEVPASTAAVEWVAGQSTALDKALRRHGAVLLRGAGVRSAADVAAIRDALGLAAAECTDRFARRVNYGDGVYSWPEWAPDRDMCLHHEQSQGSTFPRVLVLGCLATPAQGGDILLGDTREVAKHLPTDLSDRLREQGWLLQRTFRPYLGLPWVDAFGSDDSDHVEKLLTRESIGFTWSDGALRTGQLRSAVVVHPLTGESCWFNDIAFFSQWSVPEVERGVLLSAFGPQGVPFNTCFGDGGLLAESDYDAAMGAYAKTAAHVDWRPGDVLLIDNILTAHGREPYTGDWDVVVGLAEPTALSDCSPTVEPAACAPPC